MSWGRIDDSAWFHPKFRKLQANGVEGMAAIGLWIMAVSFTSKKQSPDLTFSEATMLCDGDEKLASICFEALLQAGLADPEDTSQFVRDSFTFGSSSKVLKITLHGWEEYRSKNEAKSLAGRKGGIKSGEIRKRKSKQARNSENPASVLLRSKQGTPDPDPDPDPGPNKYYRQTEFDQSISSVLSHYLEHYPKRSIQAKTQKSKSMVRARLKEGYSVDDLKKAIDALASSEFHAQGNYTQVSHALRSAEQVDKMLALKGGNGSSDPDEPEWRFGLTKTELRRRNSLGPAHPDWISPACLDGINDPDDMGDDHGIEADCPDDA